MSNIIVITFNTYISDYNPTCSPLSASYIKTRQQSYNDRQSRFEWSVPKTPSYFEGKNGIKLIFFCISLKIPKNFRVGENQSRFKTHIQIASETIYFRSTVIIKSLPGYDYAKSYCFILSSTFFSLCKIL